MVLLIEIEIEGVIDLIAFKSIGIVRAKEDRLIIGVVRGSTLCIQISKGGA